MEQVAADPGTRHAEVRTFGVAEVWDVRRGSRCSGRSTGVSVRSVGWTRWSGVAFATVFGLVATSNAIVAMTQGHWVGGAAIGAVGLVGVHWELAFSTASVDARADGVRVRSGLLRRRVAAGDIQKIRAGGPTGQSRLVLFITRVASRPQRIKTVQQMYTGRNRQALESAAVELSRAVGLSV
jgi:hypothetical protein